ncbi:ATP-dependent DNA helicase RRM3-like protein, partial [Tanacetum coccineum]
VGSIKYLFKYINKGPDRVSATIDGEEVDEIKDYLNCRIWTLRKQGKSLGRIHHVPPSWGELYYLRAILNKVRGPMEWDNLKKVGDVLYPTYKDACYARGLLQDDKDMSRPEVVWEKTWTVMAADVLNVERIKQKKPGLELSDIQRKNICLTYIECMLRSNNRSLKDIQNMPYLAGEYMMDGYNRLIFDETSYDQDKLKEHHVKLYGSLTPIQKDIYSTVMDAVDNDKGGMFFVYGYGGTGKTYLYKTMSAALRSKGEIVLNVASSGIAALLLEGGRTAHSRFAIPINDEAPMVNRHFYEAFDRTLRDICPTDPTVASDKVFGGKVFLFGGNFRQILPVITNGSRQNVVNATINASYLWQKCTILRLTVNMRLGSRATQSKKKEIQDFADWILDIGNGKVGGANDGVSTVVFSDNMLIPETDDDVGAIIDDTYPNLLRNLWHPTFFQEKAILAPTHEMVDIINQRMLSLLIGDEKEYESLDSVCLTDDDSNFDDSIYTTEFLNGIRMSGIPHHSIKLKIGTPIMLMRNIDQRAGLCIGIRLQVLRMADNIIEAKIISGGSVGTICAIPRMIISLTDTKMPFKLNRRQFPIQVCFAMTINKSQGHTLSHVGLFLRRPVFSHGQLYVAVSRVKSKKGLKVLCSDKDGNYTNSTTNVVYKEVLGRI